MKYTKQYESESAYLADSGKTIPNASLIIENDKETPKYHPYSVDGKNAKAGTIVAYKTNNTSERLFVPYQSWNATDYTAYTPSAVVVVPYSHTQDGTVRVMSLKNMDCSHPDTGSVAANGNIGTISMYWGGYGSNIPTLVDKDKVPKVESAAIASGDTNPSVIADGWMRIPSNYVKGSTFSAGTESALDPGSRYYSSIEPERYGISPYTEFDFKSYNATSVINQNTNALIDYGGKGNTEKILAVDNAQSTDWQTANTISNESGTSYVHAPAECCWRYSTADIPQGSWYLPACGELAYLPARYADIAEALTRVMTTHPNDAVRLWRNDPQVADSDTSVYGAWLWSSTEYSSGHARRVNVSHGDVYRNTKDSSNTNLRVRAFAALNV